MPDLPGRGGDRRASDRGGLGRFWRRARERREPEVTAKLEISETGSVVAHVPFPSRRAPRDGGRPEQRWPQGKGFRTADRRPPAAWVKVDHKDPKMEAPRPPRREFQERPVVERTPTAAEQDSQWRTRYDLCATSKSPVPSRDGSEALPPLPLICSPVTRPKLNLAKRTISEAPDQPSPTVSV